MSGAPEETQLITLLETARQAFAAGQRDAGMRALEQSRSLAPDHPLVLSSLAERALNDGNAAAAREMLERAVAVVPTMAPLQLNLAMACRATNDAPAEMAALDKALGLDPYFFLALLQKARLFERLNKSKQAATVYQAVLACAPSTQNPSPSLRAALDHAQSVVRANGAALEAELRDRLTAVRAKFPHEAQDRFNAGLGAMLGKQRIFTPQPTFLHFPYLPAIEFYDRQLFPWLPTLEAATAEIRGELLRVLTEDDEKFVPYVANPEGAPLNQWKELNNSRKWSVFYLWREGVKLEDHCARCPKTAALLESLPRADAPGHAPTAFFSLLQPKTHIPPHNGVTNTRLIVHLSLVIPGSCTFRVGSQTRAWRPGEAWVFDDTIEHEAWNPSELPRAVLIFDIWNPFLTEAERELVRATVAGVGDYYEGARPFGSAI
ncbi:MAG TPA: aspartyl/asparaginyl beta-hydroxylase domain-containing protein [Steroidobacteraceae bacterium]|nr:aspartyl/asparaginyl beta-hydroxylase domain-containing protein [Steroidobacteraceae bacterium]